MNGGDETAVWLGPLLGFLGGIAVALIGAIAAYLLQRRLERRNRIESERFQVYMGLMELHGLYFGVQAAELNGDSVPKDTRMKVRELAWQISDRLRSADDVDDLDRILEVLLSSGYGSAQDRYQAIEQLLRDLGDKVNPRYAAAVRQLSEGNVRRTAKGIRPSSNTPGFL